MHLQIKTWSTVNLPCLLAKHRNTTNPVLVGLLKLNFNKPFDIRIVHTTIGKSMKRYGNLYPKIYDMENLKLAHKNARKGKGGIKKLNLSMQ